jgi:small subunit ribosomal protein S16
MAVKIRMMRLGRRHRPFFRINATDSRSPRNGRILEKLGHYDPMEKDVEKQVVLDLEKTKEWISKGAEVSDAVTDILRKKGVITKASIEKQKRRDRAKEIAKKQGKFFTQAERIAAEKAAEAAKIAAEEAAKKAEEEAKAAAEAAAKAEEEAKAAAEAAAAEAEAPAEEGKAE